MLRFAGAFALASLLGAPALAAETGWSAVQRTSATTGKFEQTATLTYGHHVLRVDLPGQRLLIEFGSGAMTMVDLSRKQFARVTLEELVAVREKQMKMVREQLKDAPPEVKAQMEAQLKQAEESARRTLSPKPTEEKSTIADVPCQYYSWSGTEGSGRACVASGKLPFDASAFQKDSSALAEKMAAKGAGSAASSMAILELGKLGFPLEIIEKRTLGSSQVEMTTRFEGLKASKQGPAYFQPPKDYAKREFEAMMKEMVSRPAAP